MSDFRVVYFKVFDKSRGEEVLIKKYINLELVKEMWVDGDRLVIRFEAKSLGIYDKADNRSFIDDTFEGGYDDQSNN